VAFNRVEAHRHGNVLLLRREASLEFGMRLTRRDANGNLRFRTTAGHQGHDYYGGASGSAVANEEGVIVSVLLGGDTASGELIGAPLADLAPLIDIGPSP
jgi:hypothetical protein